MLKSDKDELFRVVKTLADCLWEQRVTEGSIQRWLANFDNETERLLALHLLAHFSYFGQREVREMLRALFRDLVRYPIVQRVRDENGGTMDTRIVEPAVDDILARTRFLGVGNPSESGTHLLYYFRQENALPRELFINSQRIFSRSPRSGDGHLSTTIREPAVCRYIFIDDLCGSGTQAKQYSEDTVLELRSLNPEAEVAYYCLFGLEEGLNDVRKRTAFTDVRALFTLDNSFRCFRPESRYYVDGESDAMNEAKAVMTRHGSRLLPEHPLGYKDGQLLVGFFHNVPDNALPVLWTEKDDWTPIFRRYPKIEWF